MTRKSPSLPFVNLHGHSTFSINDGFGFPQEHMDFAYNNGCDALALTDHGHANGMSYQLLHAKKMKEDGKEFKPIFGVEAYFLPSIEDWLSEVEELKEDKKKARQLKKHTGTMESEDEGETKDSNRVRNRRRHLILLAQNQKGLSNIFKLISESFTENNFYRFPRIDYKLLEKYNEGVMASSACLGGVYAGDYWANRDSGGDAVLDAMRRTTTKMQSIFGDRWFGEVQWNNIPEQHELNKYILQVKDEFNLKVISTADSHYPTDTAWKDRELYKRLGFLNRPTKPEWLSDHLPEDIDEIGYELYPKNGDQMFAAYKKYSAECGVDYDDEVVKQTITDTHRIAHEVIEDFMPDDSIKLPDFVIPEGMEAETVLEEYALLALKEKELHLDKEYSDRLRHELKVINGQGFAKYFLTMKAIADKANEGWLTGLGRGSAASSLVSYVLGITQIDPIKYNLIFSRFMSENQAQIGMPDIDYDVSDRMALTAKLIEEWGETSVVPISNYNTLQLRSLIKDISKFYEIPFIEVNKVTGAMINEAMPHAKAKHGIKAGVYNPTFEEVKEFSSSLQAFFRKYPHVATHVDGIYGSIRAVSRHAGGVVIGQELDKHMPLISSGGVRQTPWSEGMNVRHLEPLGFIKFDLLGLSTLAMMENAIKAILKRHHNVENPTFKDIKNYYDKTLHPDVIDFDDQKVYKKVFHKGKFVGTFQFTQAGVQNFCKRAKPTCLDELSAITSIYRPGPLSAKVDRLYTKAKNNKDSVNYLHPLIEEETRETFGFVLYQEQIATITHKIGKDITLDEGNIIRKLLTKRGTGKEKQLKKFHDRFIQGALEKKIDKTTAQEIWQTLENFAKYGFNKAHSTSYAAISYQCAWLYTYYPSEWMAAFLDKEPEVRKEKAINIAKSFGFNIRGLNVNLSGTEWEIDPDDDKTLIQPLNSLKGLGDKAIEQILNNRPFSSVEDLIFNEEIIYSKLNKKALNVLALSGALDCLKDDRFNGMKHFWSAIVVDRPKNRKKLDENIQAYEQEAEFSIDEKIANLSDLTGIFPLDLVIDDVLHQRFRDRAIPPLGDEENRFSYRASSGDGYITWCIPREIIQKKTRNKKDFWIVRVTDETCVDSKIKCWGVDSIKDNLYLNRPYIVKVNFSDQWGFSTKRGTSHWKLMG